MQGPSCDSMYIIQLLYCRVPAVKEVFVIIQLLYCRAPAVKEVYVYYTVIVLQGPSCEGGVCTLYSYCTAGFQLWGRCMYIIQLLYCRFPAVREVYVHYIVIVLQGPSCEGGVCTLYSYCTAGSKLWGRWLYRILSQQRKMYRGIQSIQIQTKPPSFKD